MKCKNCEHRIILYKSMDGGRYWKHTDGVHFYDNCKLLNDDCDCTNPEPMNEKERLENLAFLGRIYKNRTNPEPNIIEVSQC